VPAFVGLTAHGAIGRDIMDHLIKDERPEGSCRPARGRTAAAGKTDTREGAKYRKLARTRGKLKTQVAVGNTHMRVYHALLSRPGIRYEDPGPGAARRKPTAQTAVGCFCMPS
jgi:hypothetical protein